MKLKIGAVTSGLALYEVTSLHQCIPTIRRKVMIPSSTVKSLKCRYWGVSENK